MKVECERNAAVVVVVGWLLLTVVSAAAVALFLDLLRAAQFFTSDPVCNLVGSPFCYIYIGHTNLGNTSYTQNYSILILHNINN